MVWEQVRRTLRARFSALQRAEIAEIVRIRVEHKSPDRFSALQRAEIAEIQPQPADCGNDPHVSVLFNEPKLLKSRARSRRRCGLMCFSALQRAEIAEISSDAVPRRSRRRVSVLFNEPKLLKSTSTTVTCRRISSVSVLFNEPKLLKCLNDS